VARRFGSEFERSYLYRSSLTNDFVCRRCVVLSRRGLSVYLVIILGPDVLLKVLASRRRGV
jgi:hypothetical protein